MEVSYHFSELMCSVLPSFVLLVLLLPSLFLLYYSEVVLLNPLLTLKIVGHQWYWTYNYRDFGFTFDSSILGSDLITLGNFRLLEVDNSCVLPVNVGVRLLIMSSDVIHS